MRKTDNASTTFSVPAARRRINRPKPSSSTKRFAPEPTLDQTIYGDILKVMHDTGKAFERLVPFCRLSTARHFGSESTRET